MGNFPCGQDNSNVNLVRVALRQHLAHSKVKVDLGVLDAGLEHFADHHVRVRGLNLEQFVTDTLRESCASYGIGKPETELWRCSLKLSSGDTNHSFKSPRFNQVCT
jgi:hypothetical protein